MTTFRVFYAKILIVDSWTRKSLDRLYTSYDEGYHGNSCSKSFLDIFLVVLSYFSIIPELKDLSVVHHVSIVSQQYSSCLLECRLYKNKEYDYTGYWTNTERKGYEEILLTIRQWFNVHQTTKGDEEKCWALCGLVWWFVSWFSNILEKWKNAPLLFPKDIWLMFALELLHHNLISTHSLESCFVSFVRYVMVCPEQFWSAWSGTCYEIWRAYATRPHLFACDY